MKKAIEDAVTLYGENWFRHCSIKMVGQYFAVFHKKPAMFAFRRS
jgi:hypothetical protein